VNNISTHCSHAWCCCWQVQWLTEWWLGWYRNPRTDSWTVHTVHCTLYTGVKRTLSLRKRYQQCCKKNDHPVRLLLSTMLINRGTVFFSHNKTVTTGL
jgi:hypothetical protein